MNSELFAINRAHIKPFLQYFKNRISSIKLRQLARRVMKSRRKDISGQYLMFNDIQDRTFSGYLI